MVTCDLHAMVDSWTFESRWGECHYSQLRYNTQNNVN